MDAESRYMQLYEPYLHRSVGCSQSRPRDSAVADRSTQVDADVGGNSMHGRCTLPAAAQSFRTAPMTIIEGNVDVGRGAQPLW